VNHGNLTKKSQLAKEYNYDEKVEVKKNVKWSISSFEGFGIRKWNRCMV